MCEPSPKSTNLPEWGRQMRPRYSTVLHLLHRLSTHRISIDPATKDRIQQMAQKRTLIYVMPSASLLDYLLMNTLLLQNDLPLSSFANNVPMLLFQSIPTALRALRNRFISLFRSPSWRVQKEAEILLHAAQNQTPCLLFLRAPRFFALSTRWRVRIWEKLIQSQEEGSTDIAFLPVTWMWGHEPGRIEKSWMDIFFGHVSAPSPLRKIFLFLKHYNQLDIRFGDFLLLSDFLAKAEPSAQNITARKLRRTISNFLYRERKLVVGPPIRSRKRIVHVLLKDAELQRLIPSIARREKKSEKKVTQRARKILTEMISDYSPTTVALTYRVFHWIWTKLYKRMDIEPKGFKKLKNISKDYPVILLPSHKTHMDYLFLSGLFYENDFAIPHIAAGINLSFWPMGPIFRRTGAYFIRRTISGDLLYAKLLALYVKWLIRCGYTQEFFMEGGRSRTGKMLHPKHGLLGLQIDTIFSANLRDLYIVPASITYDKIPEEEAYLSELAGKKKERENIFVLLKSRSLLGKSHGAAYVRFGEPISVRKYFGVPMGEKPPTKVRRAKTLDLAHHVTREIAKDTLITRTSLAAIALLAERDQGILCSTFKERLTILRAFAEKEQKPCAKNISNIEFHVFEILEFLESHGWIETEASKSVDFVITIPKGKRAMLDFYKNTILQHFLFTCITAVAVQNEEHGGNREGNVSFLRDIFAHEFFLRKDEDVQHVLSVGLKWAGPQVRPFIRELYIAMIANYLESYDLVARMVLQTPEVQHPPTPSFILQTMEQGQRLLATHVITREESLSTVMIKSIISYFHERNLLKDREALRVWHKHLVRLRGHA